MQHRLLGPFASTGDDDEYSLGESEELIVGQIARWGWSLDMPELECRGRLAPWIFFCIGPIADRRAIAAIPKAATIASPAELGSFHRFGSRHAEYAEKHFREKSCEI